MSYTEQVFINLIANCINDNGQKNEIDFSKLDCDKLLELSRINTVCAIVYNELKKYEDAPEGLMKSLKDEFSKAIMRYSKQTSVQSILIEKLESQNIEYAIVKGPTIAKYYPSEELRYMGDIDVLVADKDYGKTKELLDSMGTVKEGASDNGYEVPYLFKGVAIELHRKLCYRKNMSGKVDYEKYFDDLISHRVKDESLYAIEPENSFIYIVYHMAEHFYYSGCGVRMLLDIAVLTKHFRETFDWESIMTELDNIGLRKFLENVFDINYKWFGIKPPIETTGIDESTFDELSNHFINAGIFGRASLNSDLVNIRKLNQESKKNDSVMRWAFPPYSYMKETNEWFKNKPAILLPVAYIVRGVGSLRKRGGIVKGLSVTGKTKQDLEKHQRLVKMMELE